MTKKIYLEPFKKCPGSLCFTLLIKLNNFKLRTKYEFNKDAAPPRDCFLSSYFEGTLLRECFVMGVLL